MTVPTCGSAVLLAASQLCPTEEVEEILRELEIDLQKSNITPQERNGIFERLRVHTTSLDNLEPLLTKRGISICCCYGFDKTSSNTSRIALRCLCNILLLAKHTRQLFVTQCYPKEAIERMKNGRPDDEFLCARLLLLCTYGTNLNFDLLFEECCIAEIINANISRHAKLIMSTQWESLSATTLSACSESLKLLYNLAAHCSHRAPFFFHSLLPILKILNNVPIPSPPLEPPMSWLINSLLHVDPEDEKSRNLLFPYFDNNINVDRLTHILDLATQAYNDEEMDRYVSPLVQVLLRIVAVIPTGAKAHLQGLLLPSNQDRERILGAGNSLPDRLLRLSTASMMPNLRELVPALLFELSGKNAEQFTHNIGYGFAAGYLFPKGVQLPANASEEAEVENSTMAGTRSFEVNPVTGQRRDMEPMLETPEMTEEEKEREAERLFVLFERLRGMGIVDVQNPVAQAVHEGRFEEVD